MANFFFSIQLNSLIFLLAISICPWCRNRCRCSFIVGRVTPKS